MKQHLDLAALSIAIVLFSSSSVWSQSKLDPTLKPSQDSAETVSQVFKEMVVVQRKAKEKAHHLLINLFENFDFSDGPTTLYGTNFNVGYAVSDYFEVYANYVPFFVANPRSIVGTISTVTNGTYSLSYATPQNQYGLEFLWAPAYGKDAWGPYTIIRSDTYLKGGIEQVQYGATPATLATPTSPASPALPATTGMRYSLTIGKTFFLSQFFNLRLGAGGSYIQIPENGAKDYHAIGIVESGLVWYL